MAGYRGFCDDTGLAKKVTALSGIAQIYERRMPEQRVIPTQVASVMALSVTPRDQMLWAASRNRALRPLFDYL